MIKILLADDHAIVRAGLKTYVQNLIPRSIVEEAYDGASAFDKIMSNNYSLVILDIIMPATDPFGLVRNILEAKPKSKILIFSMNPEEIYAKKFLNLGVLGYLNKEALGEEIKQAINKVMNNEKYLSPSLIQSLTGIMPGRKENNQNPFDLLSTRELEITMHLIKGESITQIASRLHLHTSTIGTNKARIFEKLHCKNIVEINELAILHNIIPPH